MFGRLIKTDIFGRKISKKQINIEKTSEIRRKGKAGEDSFRTRAQLSGYEVERTGRGSDFRIRKRNPFTGRVIESKLVEVKTGNSKLSKLQQRTKKKNSNYKVVREEPYFY